MEPLPPPRPADDRPLSGRSALVTGSGRGIGRRAALALAEAGARVLLCARTRREIDAVATAIREQTGGEALAIAGDVADTADVQRLADAVLTRWGSLDLVVNNAAALGPVGLLVDVDMAEWTTALAANVGGVANVTHVMVPLMRPGGNIINVSGGGIGGNAIQERVTAYTSSKAAVAVLTETLAAELEPRGIRVNAIAPGAVATRLTESIIQAGAERAGSRTYEEALRQRASPDHLDAFLRLLVWVASDRSAWLTGRLLSARWNSVEQLEAMRSQVQDPSLLRLRRIDGDLFAPLNDT